jgi:hypothetical protein
MSALKLGMVPLVGRKEKTCNGEDEGVRGVAMGGGMSSAGKEA